MSKENRQNGKSVDGVTKEILRELRKQLKRALDRLPPERQDRLLGMIKRGTTTLDIGAYLESATLPEATDGQ
jgi:hypothetical protein